MQRILRVLGHGFVALVALSAFGLTYAQRVVDPSVCFPEILRDVQTVNTTDSFKLALLSIVNRSNFEAHRSKISAVLPDFLPDMSFEQFDEKRSREFKLNSLSIDSVRTFASSTFRLNGDAKAIIEKCINAVVSQSYGFYIIPYEVNERTISVQFRWRPTGKETFVVKESVLVNAKVIAPAGVPVGSLFPHNTRISGSGYKTVLLERNDVSREIVAQIDTPNEVDLPPIVFNAAPPKVECATQYVLSNPETGLPYQKTETFSVEGNYYSPAVPGRVGHRFHKEVSVEKAGVVWTVVCDKGDQTHMCLDNTPNLECNAYTGTGEGAGTNTATCAGSSESNPRTVTMRIAYKMPQTVCKTIPWPANSTSK